MEVTGLLRAWREGRADALDELMPLVYDQLRVIAARHLARERADHTLSTTALVHEAYLHLVDQAAVDWQDRVHFYAIASRTMRRVLVWHARHHAARKRDGGRKVALEAAFEVGKDDGSAFADLVALNEALERLEAIDSRLCRVVECRFFGGLDVPETATVLQVSTATVKRDWQAARAWLRLALDDAPDAP